MTIQCKQYLRVGAITFPASAFHLAGSQGNFFATRACSGASVFAWVLSEDLCNSISTLVYFRRSLDFAHFESCERDVV